MSARVKIGLGLALALSACSRCKRTGEETHAKDAGRAAVRPSIDLRTALFTIFPEYRGARLLYGEARVNRTVTWEAWANGNATLEEALRPWMAANRFLPQELRGDAGVEAIFSPFQFRADGDRQKKTVSLEVGLEITDEDVANLLQSPAPITSEQLAYYLPALAGANATSEVFTFQLAYTAKKERADFLVRQAVDLLTSGEWRTESSPSGWEPEARPDGGVGGVPDTFSLTPKRESPHTEITFDRKPERVTVRAIAIARRFHVVFGSPHGLLEYFNSRGTFLNRSFFRAFSNGTQSVTPFAIPSGRKLVITDVEWSAYGGPNGTNPLAQGATLRLQIVLATNSSGARVLLSRGITY